MTFSGIIVAAGSGSRAGGDKQWRILGGKPVLRWSAEALLKAGIISKTLDGVKVLGNGELTKAVNVKVAAYTASAKEKIEKAGGKAEVM